VAPEFDDPLGALHPVDRRLAADAVLRLARELADFEVVTRDREHDLARAVATAIGAFIRGGR
jgi:hypothetical protein